MELNLKIIEGVRQFPALYTINNTLEERKQAWLMLADKLKIKEQILKVRWHYLLQRYNQEDNFRYACKMNFLKDYKSTRQVKTTSRSPEFVITEENLKNEKPEEKVEFHYLIQEKAEQNQNNKNIVEKENTNVTPKDHNQEHKTNAENCTQQYLKPQNQQQNQNTSKESNAEKSPTNIINKPDVKNKETAVTNQQSEKESSDIEMTFVQENIAEEIVVETSEEKLEAPIEKPKPPSNARCEDDIFGELVSAILKSMDESKKKNIKKEIMNILFS